MEEIFLSIVYAPNSPHTTVKQVRDCKSCHSNSATLGYGKGSLDHDIKNGKVSWIFTPEYALNSHDNLPEDAWIPFLEKVDKIVVNSTRTDFRPFNVEEQKAMLFVGACLQCHKEDSKVMKQTLEFGLKPILKNLSKACILPDKSSYPPIVIILLFWECNLGICNFSKVSMPPLILSLLCTVL